MNGFLKDPSASEPDILDAGLKHQLRKLMLSRPRAYTNGATNAHGGGGNKLDGNLTINMGASSPFASLESLNSVKIWKEWAFENKWGLAIILSLVGFLYYRWRYCRGSEPAILASDFKNNLVTITNPLTSQVTSQVTSRPFSYNQNQSTISIPTGYGVPAMQSNSFTSLENRNSTPMNKIGNQFDNYMTDTYQKEPMASNQLF